MFILFIIFLINYFSVQTGYYENKIHEKTFITEEKIKEFEQDIKDGKEIDIKDYTSLDYIDTTNKLDTIGYNIGEKVSDIVTNKILILIQKIGKLFS